MQKARTHSAGAVRAGQLDGALRPRVLGLAESLPGPSWLAALVVAGDLEISGEDSLRSAPVLVWRPWSPTARATFSAGAEGSYVLIGPTALANAIGHMPESREMRETAGRSVTLEFEASDESVRALGSVFNGLGGEVREGGMAAHAVIEAYLRIILVAVYRASQAQADQSDRASPSHRIFASYLALIEAHFRERWSVTDYAHALGVSRDRLGDICRRVRGLHPKDLIDRRVTLEARLQLENSSNSIQQIADLLGFASAAQFNRFFNRTVGNPPGAYRAALSRGTERAAPMTVRLHDWP